MKIDGKQIAQHILDGLKDRVNALKQRGITPHLVIILVGNNPSSETYVRQKIKKGEAIGVKVTLKHYPPTITQADLLVTIEQLNNDNNVHGIIVQRPLPDHIDEKIIDEAVDPQKDVDGFNPYTPFTTPLPAAVLAILEEIDKNFAKKKIVILGKGKTGGGPTIAALKKLGVEPIVIDSKKENPAEITKTADIIITAIGKANIITKDMVKKGVILIAVGMFKGEDGKMHGDYEEEEVKDIAGFYTPVPGGVGPVNVAMLLANVVKAGENFVG